VDNRQRCDKRQHDNKGCNGRGRSRQARGGSVMRIDATTSQTRNVRGAR
jgi:hypothetical protein